MQSKFANPYSGCVKGNNHHRLNIDVQKDRMAFLKGIRLTHGTIQTTINILIEKLYVALKTRGITTAAQADLFERFVAECELTLPRGASSGTMPKTNVRDDRGRAKGIRAGAA